MVERLNKGKDVVLVIDIEGALKIKEKLPNQIHGNTKKSRYNKIMTLQQEISRKNLGKRLGKEYEVLIENTTFDKKYLIGRTKMDVPEMDGVVYIKDTSDRDLINEFVKCKIVDIRDYDLIGELYE